VFYSKFVVRHNVQADLTVALVVVVNKSTAGELADNADNSKDAAYIPPLIALFVLEEEAKNALIKQLQFFNSNQSCCQEDRLQPVV